MSVSLREWKKRKRERESLGKRETFEHLVNKLSALGKLRTVIGLVHPGLIVRGRGRGEFSFRVFVQSRRSNGSPEHLAIKDSKHIM